MRALVVGGGIAGLSAAVGLQRAGVDVTVLERARQLGELGAALSLWGNALVALDRLGVGDAVRARGSVARRTTIRDRRGRILSDVSLDGFPAESVGIHRAELQAALLEALGRDAVRLGMRCEGFRQESEGVVARLSDGSEERGDLLVGADGLHSVVRRDLFGDEEPRYAGYVGWRAVTARDERLVDARTWSQTMAPGLMFGLIDIGRGLVYSFVSHVAPEAEEERPAGRKELLLGLVRGWHEPVEAVVEGTDEDAIFTTSIYDRPPLPRWGERSVTLAGDAAHAMTPNLGRGAAQALEDAVALAGSVRSEPDAEAALRRYEALRRKRANRFVSGSRQFGRIFHLTSPVACALRDAAIRATPNRVNRAQLVRMLGPETAKGNR